MTDTADHADYVLPATTQLEHLDVHTSYGHTYALINEPAIAPLGEARPNTQIFRELARADGLRRAVLRRQRRGAGAQAFRPRPGGVDFDALRAHGWVKLPTCPRRRSPTAASRRRAASCLIDAPGSACPTTCRTTRRRRARPALARALSAGDDLAAGAQLPQLELRQRREPARHRGRAAARDPRRPTRRRAASRRARWCGCSTTAAATSARRWSARARGPASSTAWASGGASSAPTAPTSTS